MSLPSYAYNYIFEFITSPNDIIYLYAIDDPILKSALSQSIKVVQSANGILPLDIALDLSHVEVLNVRIPIEKIDDLKDLATLPHLRRGVFYITLDNITIFEYLEGFIRSYCSGTYPLTQKVNKRNFLDKSLRLRFPSVTFTFNYNNFYLISPTFNYSYNDLFYILGVYRTYTPLYNFDFSWIQHVSSQDETTYKFIYQYLDNIPELRSFSFPSLPIEKEGEYLIISKLIKKIRGLSYRGHKRSLTLINDTYPSIPESSILQVFNLPIKLKTIPFTLRKYPRVEEILVVLDIVTGDDIDKLLSYKQLKKINIFSSSLENPTYLDPRLIFIDQML